MSSSPAISTDGTIYVGSTDWSLYAIYSSSFGLADSPWPKFHQNNQNTGVARSFEKDLGISQIQLADVVDVGSSNIINVTVSNYGTEAITNTPVSYQIDGESPVNETYTGNIDPGASVNHAFTTPWVPASLGDYAIKAYTAHAEDENTANDTTTKTVSVLYQNDVGVSEIQVSSSVGVNRTVTITVELTNDGIGDHSNFPVSYKIGSGNWITETYSNTLASQEKTDHIFSQTWTPTELGTYTIYAKTDLNGDQNTNNDNRQKNVTVADAAYVGDWEGTTSQNDRPISLYVNRNDEIDSVIVEIRVDFGSFEENRIFRNMDAVAIENDTFSVDLTTPNVFWVSGLRPVLHGEFTDGMTCDGTISSFVLMRGNNPMGTPLTNSSKTWTAERTNGTPVIEMKNEAIPDGYVLFQNYPNPFNPQTTIEYQLPKKTHVSLKVFDISGCEVLALVENDQPQGYYKTQFDNHNLPSGTYFYQLKTDEQILCKKMLILK